MKYIRALFSFNRILHAGTRRQSILTLLALALATWAAGCAPPPLPLSAIPVTGQSATFEVREYPLVEQSEDNPTHLNFQQRAPAAVSAQRDGWRLTQPNSPLADANHALAPFDFRVQPNTSPPFSSYMLTRGGEIMKKEIANFWPVTIQASTVENSPDFLLPFVTLDGEKLVANNAGIYPWPEQADGIATPVYYGEKIAYAVTDTGSLNVYSGSNLVYADPDPSAEISAEARNLYSWNHENQQHWALEIGGQVILDGSELNQANHYEESFGFSVLHGQPFYLSTQGGLTRISYAGKSLPYVYDQVVHNQSGALHIYNPGSNGSVTWFYALRDGLWYYVEAGMFE